MKNVEFFIYKDLNVCYNICMKRKIRLTDKTTGKIIEGEIEVRNLDHFQAQLRNKAKVFKSKKGKGSYTRKAKHKTF